MRSIHCTGWSMDNLSIVWGWLWSVFKIHTFRLWLENCPLLKTLKVCLDGLPWDVKTFMVPRIWILMTLVILWLFSSSATSRHLGFFLFYWFFTTSRSKFSLIQWNIADIHSMDWHKNLYKHSCFPQDESYLLWWSPDFSSSLSTTLRWTFVKCLNSYWMDCS